MGSDNLTQRWCILRTSGPKTMKLTSSLQAAGFEAWTPIERICRRVPRRKGSEHFSVAFIPTYVFVREHHLTDLRRIEMMDVSSHPRFSIFRYHGATVFVPHASLHGLRARQQQSHVASLPSTGKPAFAKPRAEPFISGDVLALPNGPFAGLNCEVDRSDGKTTTLTIRLFGRTTEMTIPTSQLRHDRVATVAAAA